MANTKPKRQSWVTFAIRIMVILLVIESLILNLDISMDLNDLVIGTHANRSSMIPSVMMPSSTLSIMIPSSSYAVNLPTKPASSYAVKPLLREDNLAQADVGPPLRVLNSYMRAHSNEQLHREYEACLSDESQCGDFRRRKFAVGFYACPQQAGNRLHHFFGAMAWSIITNRTFLYKYLDRESCLWEMDRPLATCEYQYHRTKEECENILQLAKWVPSLDEWQSKLVLHQQTIHRAHFWSMSLPPRHVQHSLQKTSNWSHSTLNLTSVTKNESSSCFFLECPPWDNKFIKYVGIDTCSNTLISFGLSYMVSTVAVLRLTNINNRNYLLHTEDARQTASNMLSVDADFLYGMLFNATFSFSTNVLPHSSMVTDPHHAHTIAIHSRHIIKDDDGSDVTTERWCLHETFKRLSSVQGKRPCTVYIMSDRILTRKGISSIVQDELNCTAVSIDHNSFLDNSTSWMSEHGPFPGAGFFRDIGLAMNARNGIIGQLRTSTNILTQTLKFKRFMHHSFHEVKGGEDLGPFLQCRWRAAE